MDEFERLDQEEKKLLYKVPVLVTILIAGADSVIDNAEIKEAIEIAKDKKNKSNSTLNHFYHEVDKSFEEDLKSYLAQLPDDTIERNKIIIQQLKKLNDILPKLDKKFAKSFYENMRELAKKIAEASGGVLGYMAVGEEESEFVDLKMINNPA